MKNIVYIQQNITVTHNQWDSHGEAVLKNN